MMLWKCYTQYGSRFGKLSSSHRTGKDQFSFQSQRKAMSKNVQTAAQWHYFTCSKVMLNIHQAKLQQYVNWELLQVQAGFRKGRRTRDQIANIRWIIEKIREFQKISTSASLTMLKPLTVWITTNWNILIGMRITDFLTCLLRNLYEGQQATARTGYGPTDWFQIGKGVRQGCILSPCLFNLYAEYIMQMPGWIKHKLGSKLSGEISI